VIAAPDRRQQARDRARRRVRRERRIAAGVALAVVLAVGAVFALSKGGSAVDTTAATAAHGPPGPPQLPRGGRTLLPRYRIVAYYGAPEDAQFGQLGIGTPDAAARGLLAQAARYAGGGRPLQPAFELIATVVTAAPGDDGNYRYRQPDAVIDRYLAAARRAKALLILDIQPGRADFLQEVRAYDRYLRQPDVGLALDPEWSMRPGQVPGTVIGSTDASVVNRAAAQLARIVKQDDLPEKLLIVHQFTPGMIRHKRRLAQHPGVALVVNVDGFGNPPNKISKYRLFARRRAAWYNGFKLFYHEDTRMMRPRAVLRLRPPPDVIIYE
jgi:hypothetical protein